MIRLTITNTKTGESETFDVDEPDIANDPVDTLLKETEKATKKHQFRVTFGYE